MIKDVLKKLNLFTILVAVLTFTLGWQLGHRNSVMSPVQVESGITVTNQQEPKNVNIDFKLFWDTWNLVSQQYVDKKAIDPQKMYYGAIQGMVAAIGDPYTMFLPPAQQTATKEDLGGSFDGVGLELGFNKDKQLVVMAPLDGDPAQKAGILAGDLIVKINNKDTSSIALPDAVNLIRGPKGSQVDLTIFRNGDNNTRDFKLTRDTIIVKSVNVVYKNDQNGNNIAVIKLTRFGEMTDQEWNDAVTQILAKGVKGVVLDLRDNPGGYLDDAVYIASEFLSGGNVVLQQDSAGQKSPYPVNRQGRLLTIPLVVLINKGSASASEIVSGALQDRGRAKLVGTQSFGKGTVQATQDLAGGTGLHITVAKWLTPNGRWVNALGGLTPDVEVDLPVLKPGETPDDSQDVQLDKAIEVLSMSNSQ